MSEEGTADDDLEWEEWNPSKISFLKHMIAGSVAGLTEHITLFPIDTIKTHVQCDRCGSISPMQTWNCASRMVNNEGLFRLWRGVSAMFAGCIPAHAAYFSVFEFTKILTGANQQGHHPIPAAFCGASAAFSHDFFMTPFDVIKQRMQLGHYRSFTHCLGSIVRKEGFKALYVSFPMTLLMNIPYGCIMVPVNESIRKILNPSQNYNFSASMIAGSVAGGVAAAVTNPLDVLKTRLQVQELQSCPIQQSKSQTFNLKAAKDILALGAQVYNNNAHATNPKHNYLSESNLDNTTQHKTIQTTKPLLIIENSKKQFFSIIEKEGWRGFMRGMFPRILVQAPAVAISWTAYESMKTLLAPY
eukprot:gene5564-7686_t